MSIRSMYTPNLPEILDELKISIIFTSNRNNKVFIINTKDKTISQLVKEFDIPMGIALSDDKLAIATRSHVEVFFQDSHLAKTYPKLEGTYDNLLYPIAKYNTFDLDNHDIAFTRYGLIVVQTRHNALVQISSENKCAVLPIWNPPFIENRDEIRDVCHLNGMAVDENGDVRYATTFSSDGSNLDWRNSDILKSGVLIDVTKNEIVYQGLSMPHSPRFYKGELYLFSSATEDLLKFNPTTKKMEQVIKIDGYLRGLDFYDDYAFIGVSRIRTTHIFAYLPITKKMIKPGIVIVKLSTKEIVGELVYEEGMDEVFDIKIMNNSQKVNLVKEEQIQKENAIILPYISGWYSMRQDKIR